MAFYREKNQVQILNKAVDFLHSTNTLSRDMNPTILPQLWIDHVKPGMATSLGEGKTLNQ